MRYSLRLFTWLGIPVFLHWSFGLILAYVAYIAYSEDLGWIGGVAVLAMFLIIFGCVLLHEYGHALAARRYGVGTEDIILTPIGGIARLNGMTQKPAHEFVVAIAGPLVNVGIVLVLLVFSFFIFEIGEVKMMLGEVSSAFSNLFHQFSGQEQDNGPSPSAGLLWEIFSVIVTANCFLFAFNLIPAFPMDGGRIFRALMEMKVGKLEATKYASFFGQAIALFFIYQGFQSQPHTLALIGVFIFFAARKEYRSLLSHTFMAETKVSDVMKKQFVVLPKNSNLGTALAEISGNPKQPIILLNDLGMPYGTVDLVKFGKAYQEKNMDLELLEISSPFLTWVNADMNLLSLYGIFETHNKSVLAVKAAEDWTLLGILEPNDIAMALRKAG